MIILKGILETICLCCFIFCIISLFYIFTVCIRYDLCFGYNPSEKVINHIRFWEKIFIVSLILFLASGFAFNHLVGI